MYSYSGISIASTIIEIRNKGFIQPTTDKPQGGIDMKRLTFMLIIVLIILGITSSRLSAFAFTGAYIPTAPVAEPVLMIFLGAGFIGLGVFGRKVFNK